MDPDLRRGDGNGGTQIMFNCTARKHIYRNYEINGDKELGCEASYDFELPFVPYPGLHIDLEKASFMIESISYNTEKKEFCCRCGPDYLKPMDGCGYEGLKRIAEEDGWALFNETESGIFDND